MAPTERYLRLTRLAQQAFSKGRLERSLRLFVAAEEEARRLGDRELSDRAFCNRCVVLLELERLDGAVGELKNVLMRSRDPFTAWMAAYYTSQVYEVEGNIKRALAYARRATELAETSGEAKAKRASANRHGVLALKDSRFDEARGRFEEALRFSADGPTDVIGTAIIRDNLGYCLMCVGQVDHGLEFCREATASLEAIGAQQYLAEAYQDLCYGHLQRAELDQARTFGDKALALARRFDDSGVERNTLMLLADAAIDSGDEEVADLYLQSLSVHYPDFRGMVSFLRAFNVREVINLKA